MKQFSLSPNLKWKLMYLSIFLLSASLQPHKYDIVCSSIPLPFSCLEICTSPPRWHQQAEPGSFWSELSSSVRSNKAGAATLCFSHWRWKNKGSAFGLFFHSWSYKEFTHMFLFHCILNKTELLNCAPKTTGVIVGCGAALLHTYCNIKALPKSFGYQRSPGDPNMVWWAVLWPKYFIHPSTV